MIALATLLILQRYGANDLAFSYAGSVILHPVPGMEVEQVNPILQKAYEPFSQEREAENHLEIGDSDDKSSEYNYYSENALGNSIVEVFVQPEKGLRKINYVLSCTQVTPHHLVLKQSLVALLQLCPRKPRSVMATSSFAFQNIKKMLILRKCSATIKKKSSWKEI